MPSISQTTDNAPTDHARVLSLGLEMACESVNHYGRLSRGDRRALLTAWAGFVEDLAALGVRVQSQEA